MKTSMKRMAGFLLVVLMATGSWTLLAQNSATSPGYPGPIKGTTTNLPPGATDKLLPGMTTNAPPGSSPVYPKGAPQSPG
jgi:hypothetical protein